MATGISANKLELLQIADAVAREKGIEVEIVLSAMADAIEIGLCSQQVRDDMVEYGFHRLHDFEFGHLANRLCRLYRAHLLK